MTRPDVHLVELRLGREVDPARGHEAQRALDLGGELLVAPALGRGGDELLVPLVDAHEVGEAALRERPQQVQRRRRVVIGLHHAVGIGDAGLERRGVVVDHVAAEGRDVLPTHVLGRRRARLGELPGDPPHLHDRERGAVREHGRHLEHDLELLADVDGREVVERLGAFARLEQERAALHSLGQHRAQLPRLAGEDERRHDSQAGPARPRPAPRSASPAGGAPNATATRRASRKAWSLPSGLSVVSHNRRDRARPFRNPADGREAPRQLRRRHPPLGGPAARGRRLPPDRRPARDHGPAGSRGAARVDARPRRAPHRRRASIRTSARSSSRATCRSTRASPGCSSA